MEELTQRQKELLKTIIEKYIETAEPIGSEVIEKESSLGISPATIRNEMVKLTKLGFLKQPHTSAGRVPTTMALKFYIDQLMSEKELSVKDEVAIKESLWDYRYQLDKLLREAVRELAEKTLTLSLATTDDGQTFSSGLANILDMPEFYDIDLTKGVLALFDQPTLLEQIFFRTGNLKPINIILGDELPISYLEPVSFVFSPFNLGQSRSGVIGVIGPARLNYSNVIPPVRYLGDLLNEVTAGW